MPIKLPLRINFKRSSSVATNIKDEDNDDKHYSTLGRVFRRVKPKKVKPRDMAKSQSVLTTPNKNDMQSLENLVKPIKTQLPSVRETAITTPAKLQPETVSTSSGCHSDDGKTIDSNQTNSTKKSFTSKTSNHRKKDKTGTSIASSSSTPSPPQHLISSGYSSTYSNSTRSKHVSSCSTSSSNNNSTSKIIYPISNSKIFRSKASSKTASKTTKLRPSPSMQQLDKLKESETRPIPIGSSQSTHRPPSKQKLGHVLSEPAGIHQSKPLSRSINNIADTKSTRSEIRGIATSLRGPNVVDTTKNTSIFGTLPRKKDLLGSTSTLNELKNRFIRAPSEIRGTKSTNVFSAGDSIQVQMEDFKTKYEVTGVIGRGGGGTVYSGIRRTDRQIVAIKQVPKGKVKRWGKIEGNKVPIEFDLLKRVHNKHDSIISMLDWYERRTSYVLIMERPPNSIDLFEYINKKGILAEDQARHMIIQIVEVMITCLKENVFHRDIKDENIMVCGNNYQVKLIDFGCGTNVRKNDYTEFAGTPEFYPPEWFHERRYCAEPQTAWSVGVLLWAMLQGEVPFASEADVRAYKGHIFELRRRVQLSEEVMDLLQKILTIDERKRYTLKQILKSNWMRKSHRNDPLARFRESSVRPQKRESREKSVTRLLRGKSTSSHNLNRKTKTSKTLNLADVLSFSGSKSSIAGKELLKPVKSANPAWYQSTGYLSGHQYAHVQNAVKRATSSNNLY